MKKVIVMFFKNKTKINLIFLTIVIFLTFGFGVWVGNSQKICEICPPQDIDFSLFWESYQKIKEKFVDTDKIDTQEIVYGAISGMVKSLDDPYTVFFPPKDTKRFIEDVQGVFEGVGMEIGIRNSQLQVIAPLEGTPAQKAGLLAGDKILKVDDQSTADITIDEAVNLIRGPRGTDVVLTVYREDWRESKEITITRGVIEIPSLRWELLENDSIAYIKLYQFSQKAAYDFRNTVLDILDVSAKKIIIDLRNNPGGYLEVAQDIAGWFLEKGELVVIEEFGDGAQIEYKADGNPAFLGYDVVVLINEGSASGSEILAGALRDNRDILLVGEKSFGKGSVQELVNLRGGSSLKVTVAKWLTPKGHLITEVGLEPDVEVKMTSEDYEEGKDPQLDKAIELLKSL
jgi:carboxyl-terminal processing protease